MEERNRGEKKMNQFSFLTFFFLILLSHIFL